MILAVIINRIVFDPVILIAVLKLAEQGKIGNGNNQISQSGQFVRVFVEEKMVVF